MKNFALILIFICLFLLVGVAKAQIIQLKYKASPPDNPLKGLVPYEGQGETFPHSMEFWYFPMSSLMTGSESFDWSPIESKLARINGRGCQAVIRVYMEYPGEKSAAPKFLIDQGIKITKYNFDNNVNFTPDYNDQRTRSVMKSFIAAFGKKYNGDPRIGFITMGILGHWGEWHTYPKEELFASEEVQTEVMDAYQSVFTQTKILMRYPAGPETWHKAPNHKRSFGYHDDSFSWATLDTGKEEDDWFFEPAMKSAGPEAVEKWKTQPIGGEIRPEVWGCVFDNPSCAPAGQGFEKCVVQTHATWLMDSGMFSSANSKPMAERKQEAIRQVQKMGYELFVKEAELKHQGARLSIKLTVTNRGVAPFYYNWPMEVIVTEENGNVACKSTPDWKLTGILPGDEVHWAVEMKLPHEMASPKISIMAANPMSGGKPLRFANESQLESGSLLIN